eukprot:SAG11_NODE_32489_length_283_cov_0.820652_2_plen_49_part_01
MKAELRAEVAGLLMGDITAEAITVNIEPGSVVLTIGGLPPWAAAAVASG